jgi:hypothetical protein
LIVMLNGLERDFARSQEFRPILLWSSLLGMAASVATPLVMSTDAAQELGLSRVGLLGAIVLPYLLFSGAGQLIYWLIVRAGRRDATFAG